MAPGKIWARATDAAPAIVVSTLALLITCACVASNPAPQHAAQQHSAPRSPAPQHPQADRAESQQTENVPPPTESESAQPVRVFVQALVADATLDDAKTWAGETFETIGTMLAERGQLRSSTNLLATHGVASEIALESSATTPQQAQLARVGVTPHVDDIHDQVRLDLEVSFSDGRAARTSLALAAEQKVLVPLDNGPILVVRSDIVRSQADLSDIYERKLAAARPNTN